MNRTDRTSAHSTHSFIPELPISRSQFRPPFHSVVIRGEPIPTKKNRNCDQQFLQRNQLIYFRTTSESVNKNFDSLGIGIGPPLCVMSAGLVTRMGSGFGITSTHRESCMPLLIKIVSALNRERTSARENGRNRIPSPLDKLPARKKSD